MIEPSHGGTRTVRDLVTVLQLEKLLRQCGNPDELAFRIVNDSRRAVPYEQAILWLPARAGGLRPEAATGLSRVDPQAPQLQELGRLLAALPVSEDCKPVDPGTLVDGLSGELRSMGYEYPLWCPFRDLDGRAGGGLFLTRGAPWTEADTLRLEFLSGASAHALFHLRRHIGSWRLRRERWMQAVGQRRLMLAASASVIVLFLLPVPQSVVAAAEVVAIAPLVLSPPVDGVIASVEIAPNTAVGKGQILFMLDDRLIRNRHEVALKALEVARADLARAAAKAFSDPQSKAEIAVLSAVAEQRAAEVNYTAELLERIRVRAPAAGVVLFPDANELLGKPVVVGERIMTLADESRTELLLWVPVSEAIALEAGAEVRAFLNVDPTRTLPARIRQTSYTAEASPDGVLSYRVRASLESGMAPRIGLKATAKIYGARAPLIYDLLRRPLAALRRQLGW